MRALSLDRWSFFHTRLGFVNFYCKPVKGDTEYVCLLARENSCDVTNPKLKFLNQKSDKELIADYLELYNVERNFSILYTNYVAFPSITNEHRVHIKKMIKLKNLYALQNYVIENNCLKGSILPSDFIRQSPLYQDLPNTEIDDSNDSECSD